MLGHSERTAVVLASSSFAGSCFCNVLMANGVKVIGTVRSSSNLFIGERLYNLRNPLYREIRCDTATSLPELTKVLNFKKVDWVIDFANQGMVAPSWDHPNVWYQTNLSAKSEFIRYWLRVTAGRYLKFQLPRFMDHRQMLSPLARRLIHLLHMRSHMPPLINTYSLFMLIGGWILCWPDSLTFTARGSNFTELFQEP